MTLTEMTGEVSFGATQVATDRVVAAGAVAVAATTAPHPGTADVVGAGLAEHHHQQSGEAGAAVTPVEREARAPVQ